MQLRFRQNLLPYWLTRYPDHELAGIDRLDAAKQVRGFGERGDVMARHIFEQQAMALGRLFTIAANFTDPDAIRKPGLPRTSFATGV